MADLHEQIMPKSRHPQWSVRLRSSASRATRRSNGHQRAHAKGTGFDDSVVENLVKIRNDQFPNAVRRVFFKMLASYGDPNIIRRDETAPSVDQSYITRVVNELEKEFI